MLTNTSKLPDSIPKSVAQPSRAQRAKAALRKNQARAPGRRPHIITKTSTASTIRSTRQQSPTVHKTLDSTAPSAQPKSAPAAPSAQPATSTPPVPVPAQTAMPVSVEPNSFLKRRNDSAKDSADKRLKFTFNDIATVIVNTGSKRTTFKIHEQILCQHSTFFKAALTGEWWNESTNRIVNLPDQDPEIFQAYVQLCYDQSARPTEVMRALVGEMMKEIVCDSPEAREDVKHFGVISELWILGDYLGNSRVMNAVMDDLLGGAVSDSTIAACCQMEGGLLKQVAVDSMWRRWLEDAIAAMVDESMIDRCADFWPADFTRAVFKKFVAASGGSKRPEKPTIAKRSRYIVDDLT